MFEKDGKNYATLDEVKSFATAMNEADKEDDAKLRADYSAKYAKFEEAGATLLYQQVERGVWHDWEWTPVLLFDGVLMSVSDYTLARGATVEMSPILPPNLYYSPARDSTAVKALDSRQPQKVGKPTAKKLQAWADWCRSYVDALTQASNEIRDRRATAIAKIKAIQGTKDLGDGMHFCITRGVVTCNIAVSNDGYIYKEYVLQRSMVSQMFMDI